MNGWKFNQLKHSSLMFLLQGCLNESQLHLDSICNAQESEGVTAFHLFLEIAKHCKHREDVTTTSGFLEARSYIFLQKLFTCSLAQRCRYFTEDVQLRNPIAWFTSSFGVGLPGKRLWRSRTGHGKLFGGGSEHRIGPNWRTLLMCFQASAEDFPMMNVSGKEKNKQNIPQATSKPHSSLAVSKVPFLNC